MEALQVLPGTPVTQHELLDSRDGQVTWGGKVVDAVRAFDPGIEYARFKDMGGEGVSPQRIGVVEDPSALSGAKVIMGVIFPKHGE